MYKEFRKLHFFDRKDRLILAGKNVTANLSITISQVTVSGNYALSSQYLITNALMNEEFWVRAFIDNQNMFLDGLK